VILFYIAKIVYSFWQKKGWAHFRRLFLQLVWSHWKRDRRKGEENKSELVLLTHRANLLSRFCLSPLPDFARFQSHNYFFFNHLLSQALRHDEFLLSLFANRHLFEEVKCQFTPVWVHYYLPWKPVFSVWYNIGLLNYLSRLNNM
jgi:hypothetical protein